MVGADKTTELCQNIMQKREQAEKDQNSFKKRIKSKQINYYYPAI